MSLLKRGTPMVDNTKSLLGIRSAGSLRKLPFCYCHGAGLYRPHPSPHPPTPYHHLTSTPILEALTTHLPGHQGFKPQTLLLTARLGEPNLGVPGQRLPDVLAQGSLGLLLQSAGRLDNQREEKSWEIGRAGKAQMTGRLLF